MPDRPPFGAQPAASRRVGVCEMEFQMSVIPAPALSRANIDSFVTDGFVRLDAAFSTELADTCRGLLWQATGLSPDAPHTWTQPVVRIGQMNQLPFVSAANTERLHSAYDQLVGAGRWVPPGGLGTFPIRFPSAADPGDAGWHIDVSFGFEENPTDFLAWRANVFSRGRSLLMLFLFSEVGPDDAPTRIRVGSHLDIARQLAPHGEAGLSLRELAADDFAGSAHRPQVLATGGPGTVYLCHPFLVHAAQPHRGTRPRFMAQPPLLPRGPLRIEASDAEGSSPVERAIRLALE